MFWPTHFLVMLYIEKKRLAISCLIYIVNDLFSFIIRNTFFLPELPKCQIPLHTVRLH